VFQPTANPLDIGRVTVTGTTDDKQLYYMHENCSDRVYANCKNPGVVHIFDWQVDLDKAPIVFKGTLQMAE
jgi:hypothetical protein